jgi:hypothetical protein
MIQYREEEKKLRALQVILFCHFWTDRFGFCRNDYNPQHSCGDPNAVVFTLAMILYNSTHREARLDLISILPD